MGQTSPQPPRHVFSRDVTPQCYSSGYMLLDVMGGCQAVAVTLEQPIKCPRLAVRSTATPIMCLCVSVTVCWTLLHYYAYCLREFQCLQVSIKVLRRLQSKLKCIHPTISLLCLCHFCLRIVVIIIISSMHCHYHYHCYVSQAYFPPSLSLLMLPRPSRYIFPPVPVYFVLRDCFRPELQSTVQVQIKGLFTEVPLHIQLQQYHLAHQGSPFLS